MGHKVIHILSIEDNPADAYLLQEILTEATRLGWDLPRFRVERVGRLADGLARLHTSASDMKPRIDVILTDLDLPDSYAEETFAALHAEAPEIPIVVLTGRDDEALAQKTVRAGAEDYLFKRELSGSLLAHALIYAVERKQAKQALEQARAVLEQHVAERTEALRQANAALRESSARFQIAAASVSDLIYEWDVASNRLDWFGGIDTALGYAPGAFPRTLEAWLAHIHPDDRPWLQEAAERRRHSVTPIAKEYRVRRLDGAWRRWVDRGTCVVDEKGLPSKWIGACIDVTERRRMEATLHAREEKLRFQATLLEQIQDQIVATDLEGRITYVNDAVVKALNIPREELLGETVHILGEDLQTGAAQQDIIDATLQTGSWQGTVANRTRNGAATLLEARTWIVHGPDGEPTGMVGVSSDITERRQAEQKIRHLNSVLGAIRQVNRLIVQTRDRDALLQSACETLVSTRGYFNAWIALLDSDHQFIACHESSLQPTCQTFVHQLAQGKQVRCMREVLAQERLLVTHDPGVECAGCPMQPLYEQRSALTLRLDYAQRVYGVLSVSIPRRFAQDKEERRLLEELAGDIAFALHTLEREAERREFENALQLHRHITSTIAYPVSFVDRAYRYRTVNEAYSDIFGMKIDEIVGKTVRDLCGDDIFETEIQPQLDRALAGETVNYQVWVDFPKAGRRYMDMHYAPFIQSDGEIAGVVSHASDLTERQRSEEALQESESRFREMAKAIHDVFWMTHPESSQILYVSPAYEEIWGASLEALYANPRTWMEAIHPDDYDSVVANQQRQRQGEATHEEFRILRPDNTARYIANRSYPIRDAQGRVYRVTGIAEDITARKHVEAALQRSEARYRLLVESAPDAIFTVGETGVFLFMNGVAARRLGGHPEDFTGKTMHELFPPEIARTQLAEIQKVIRTQESLLVERQTILDGVPRWYRTSIQPLPATESGKPAAMLIAHDITERKHIEQALQSSRESLAKAQAIAHLGSWSLDTAHNVLDWSDEMYRLLGFTPGDPPEPTLEATLLKVHPDDREAVKTWFCEALAQKPPASEIEFRTLPSDGASRIIRALAEIERDAAGNVARVHGVDIDITAHRRAEEAIRQHVAEIERHNEELERFVYGISHDLREPLRTMQGYLELIQWRFGYTFDDELNRLMDHALESGQQIQEMVAGLLRLSRMTTARASQQVIDSQQVLEQTLQALRYIIEKSDATITYDPLPILNGDPIQLQQVFQNLIANALKFQRAGNPPRVHVTATPAGDAWRFSVKDNGIGIDPAQRERLFKVFSRLHPQDSYPGAGIGLAICKKAVEGHGGSIWVESQPGSGATFYFTWPAL